MMNLIKKSNDYIKTMDCWDIGVLKVCTMSFGMLAGLAVSKENKSKAAVAAGALFALTGATVMKDYIKFMAEGNNEKDLKTDLHDELFDDDNIDLI